MIDQEFLDHVGLSMTTLFASMGKVCAENFPLVLDALKFCSEKNDATKVAIAEGFKLWCTCSDTDIIFEVLKVYAGNIYFDIISELAVVDDYLEGSTIDYKGSVFIAAAITEGICTCAQMDQSQQLMSLFSPMAYQAAARILNKGTKYAVKSSPNDKDTDATYRSDILRSLFRTLPYSGSVDLKDGFKIAVHQVFSQTSPTLPEPIRLDVANSINTIVVVARDSITPYGQELLDIALIMNNASLLIPFATSPDLYLANPDIVHNNIELFLHQPYALYASLFIHLSIQNPNLCILYLPFFLQQLISQPTVGIATLSILTNIAAVEPSILYPHIPMILSYAQNISGSSYIVAKMIHNVAQVTSPENVADNLMGCMIDLFEMALDKNEMDCIPSILMEIAGMISLLSTKEVFLPFFPRIAKVQALAAEEYQFIADIFIKNSLDYMEDEAYPMILPCDNADNLASAIAENPLPINVDMINYLTELRKLLPLPTRLEIHDMQPHGIVLYFQCCHSGYEYVLTSDQQEWKSWLKIVLCLLTIPEESCVVSYVSKRNTMERAIDGEKFIREYYDSVKTTSDEDFLVFHSHGILIEAEQQRLVEFCHMHKLFDIFAYDKEKNGWYFVHPSRDGMILAHDHLISSIENPATTTASNHSVISDCTISETKIQEFPTTFNQQEKLLEIKITSNEDTDGDCSTEPCSVIPTVSSMDEQVYHHTQEQQHIIMTYQKKMKHLEGYVTTLETRIESLNMELHKLQQQQQQQQQHASAGCGCILS